MCLMILPHVQQLYYYLLCVRIRKFKFKRFSLCDKIFAISILLSPVSIPTNRKVGRKIKTSNRIKIHLMKLYVRQCNHEYRSMDFIEIKPNVNIISRMEDPSLNEKTPITPEQKKKNSTFLIFFLVSIKYHKKFNYPLMEHGTMKLNISDCSTFLLVELTKIDFQLNCRYKHESWPHDLRYHHSKYTQYLFAYRISSILMRVEIPIHLWCDIWWESMSFSWELKLISIAKIAKVWNFSQLSEKL